MRIPAGETFVYEGDLTRIQFFQESASAVLNVHYSI